MSHSAPIAAFNRTRRTCLAENVRIARTHWSRLRGLVGTDRSAFQPGQALWIVPCRGVHTLAMRFPLDLIYLSQFNRSEEHTSELQSRPHLVCRLLLEKKKKKTYVHLLNTKLDKKTTNSNSSMSFLLF